MGDLKETVLLSMKADYSDLVKKSAELKDQAAALTGQLKLQRAELSELEKVGKQNTAGYKQLSQEIKANELSVTALNKQQAVSNKAVQDGIQFNTSQKGSIVQLRAEYNKMKDEYIKMSSAERDNKDVGGQMLIQLKEKSDKLKALESAYGDNRRNVGNYGDALKGLNGTLLENIKNNESVGKIYGIISGVMGKIATSYKEVSSLVVTMSKEIAAERAAKIANTEATQAQTVAVTEVAAAEGAAVVATEAETVALEAQTVAAGTGTTAMKVLKFALASTGIGLLIVAVGTLVAYFESTNEGAKKLKVIMAVLNSVFQEGLKVLGAFGKVVYDVLTVNIKDLGKDIKDAGTAMGGLVGNTIETGKAAATLTKERFDLTKAEREWSSEKIKQQKEVDLLTMKLRQQTLGEAERVKMAEEAKIKRKAIFDTDLEHAQKNFALIEREQALNSKKDYQAITDAKNKVEQIKATYETDVQNIENRESRVQMKMERGAITSLKSKITIQKEHDAEMLKLAKEAAKEEIKCHEEASKASFDLLDKELAAMESASWNKVSLTEQEANQMLAIRKLTNEEVAKMALMSKDQQIKYIKDIQKTEVELAKTKSEASSQAASNIVGTLGAINTATGDNAEMSKQISVAQAIISTYEGATKALAEGGVFGFLGAAAIVAAGLANVSKIESTPIPKNKAAGGGDFLTTGPTMLMVGDNPGGVERISVEPISGYGTTHVDPQSNLVRMAGGGRLTSDGGYAQRNQTHSIINYDELAKALASHPIYTKITDINKMNANLQRVAKVSEIN